MGLRNDQGTIAVVKVRAMKIFVLFFVSEVVPCFPACQEFTRVRECGKVKRRASDAGQVIC